jgi:hypothetical protein
MRKVLLLVGMLGITALAASCSGGDPSAIEFKPRGSSGGGGSSSGGTSSGGSSGSDGGSSGNLDPKEPISNVPYASSPPSANGHRMGGAGGINALDATINCTAGGNCHGGTAPKFITGGVLVDKAGSTTRVADAEIWISDGAGKRFKANTDTDGAFWFPANVNGAPAALPATAYAGVRTKDNKTAKMATNAGGQACGGSAACHAGGQGAVYVSP